MDGYIELRFNEERTQAFADIYPPKDGGNAVHCKDVLERLRQMGVMYGVREAEIMAALRFVDGSLQTQKNILVAQGVLPVDGQDAQILWKVEPELVQTPLPRRADGEIDYFALPDTRLVKAGQLLANIIPARPGTPGKTLTAPLQPVKQRPGSDTPLVVGSGVRLSEDRTQYIAEADGYFEVRRDRLTVYAMRKVEGSLPSGDHQFSGGIIITGDVRGGSIHAEGVVAIRGSVAGATIRTRGNIYVGRSARATLVTEGSIHARDTLTHCELVARRKIVTEPGAAFIGGSLTGGDGIVAATVGSDQFLETHLISGVDKWSPYRLDEVQQEIDTSEANMEKISQALRPLTSASSSDALSPQKKLMVQTLIDQKRGLETRIRELHGEKRTLMMNTKARLEGAICATGTIHPGVWITLQGIQMLVESPLTAVAFIVTDHGRSLQVKPLQSSQAA